MNKIVVLWSHPDDPTIPPPVCPDTCRSVKEVVANYRDACIGRDLTFSYVEEISPDISSCGRLTIDGIPLEELVPLPDPSKYCGMACDGCRSGDAPAASSCKRMYEQIPESVLRLALSKTAGKYL